MANGHEEEREREKRDRVFEILKHASTLNVATLIRPTHNVRDTWLSQRCRGNLLRDWPLDSLRVSKQDLLQPIGTPRPPRRVLVQFEELHSALFAEGFTEIEEPELGHDDGALKEGMALHSPQPADGARTDRGVTLDLVAGESLATVLNGQAVLLNPNGDLSPGESFLGVEPEALENKIAEVVEGARVAGREERPGEILLLVAWRLDPGEHF